MWKFGALAAGGSVGLALAVRSAFSGSSAQAREKEEKQHVLKYPVTTNDWSKARKQAKVLAELIKESSGSPGLLMAVAVDGKLLCSEAFGFADVENAVRCNRETRMRIASISKPITMLAVARLWEDGKLDLDAPIQHYTSFPQKTFNGESVTITTRQLVSHVAGIRHYKEIYEKKMEGKTVKNQSTGDSEAKKKTLSKASGKKTSGKEKQESTLTYSAGEYGRKEYHIKEQFDSVEESVKLFADDDLVHQPGSAYLYSTHGWTLVSAVVEGAAKEDFLAYLTRMLSQLGLRYITPEYQTSLIYGRARYYNRNKSGQLLNAPYVNNSYKWGGGGLLSNAEDLVHFGNVMLYSYQANPEKQLTKAESSADIVKSKPADQMCEASFLKPSSVAALWKAHPVTVEGDSDRGYGMGWVVSPGHHHYGGAVPKPAVFSHTGGAIGASSVLLIQPSPRNSQADSNKSDVIHGVVVALICNMESVRLEKTAQEIASVFEAAREPSTYS